MKYYKQYKLKKELPDYPVGWLFSWCGNSKKYIPHKIDWRTHDMCGDSEMDYDSKTTFTKDEIESTGNLVVKCHDCGNAFCINHFDW